MTEDRVQASRAAMQKLTETTSVRALEAMKRYVANRLATYDAFARMDPNSSQTADAKALLETARQQLKDLVGPDGREPDDS